MQQKFRMPKGGMKDVKERDSAGEQQLPATESSDSTTQLIALLQ